MGDARSLRSIRGFVFDMDGVIYRGDTVLPGAMAFISLLRRKSIPFVFFTNNSTTPAALVADRLAGMGIRVQPSDILTSAEITAAELSVEMPGRRVLLIGEEGIRLALAERGFLFTNDHQDADIVVVGLDRQCTYAKLQEATLAVLRGCPLVATNIDRSLPTPIGLIPGAGALVAALEAATSVQARNYGKPSPEGYRIALSRLGTLAAETGAVGDRPDTDILGGQRAGLRTIGVLTGVGTRASFAALQPAPDWVFEDLAEVGKLYFGAEWVAGNG